MSAVSPEIAADFLVEAGEILERLGEQLVQLEQAADDKGLLNAVFRGFHTIKGGAGFLGLVPMVELCHALEDAFDKAREGKILLDDDAFDYAQRCHDTLSAQMAALGAGQPLEPADPELIAAIKAWASGQTTTKPAKTEAAKAAPKPKVSLAELRCGHCNKAGAPSLCSKCAKVVYCDKHCQKQDWKVHKQSCRDTSQK